MYALCLALGVPSKTAWTHLTKIRKHGETFETDVMSTNGGQSFQAQLSVSYELLKKNGTDDMLSRTLPGYTVIPTWVAVE